MIPEDLEHAIRRELAELKTSGTDPDAIPNDQLFTELLDRYRRTGEFIGMLRAVQHCGTLAETKPYAALELELQQSRATLGMTLLKLHTSYKDLIAAQKHLIDTYKKHYG